MPVTPKTVDIMTVSDDIENVTNLVADIIDKKVIENLQAGKKTKKDEKQAITEIITRKLMIKAIEDQKACDTEVTNQLLVMTLAKAAVPRLSVVQTRHRGKKSSSNIE